LFLRGKNQGGMPNKPAPASKKNNNDEKETPQAVLRHRYAQR